MSSPSQLWLEKQICFPLYAVSRLMTKQYTPLLDELGITYPQYLVLLVLWQTDHLVVSELSKKLLLDSNTLTPLLKRLEQKGLITRTRLQSDERKVNISLTNQGEKLQDKAVCIPERITDQVNTDAISSEEMATMIATVHKLLDSLSASPAKKGQE